MIPDAALAERHVEVVIPARECARRTLGGVRLCRATATIRMLGACVHEHCYESNYCEAHAPEARARLLNCEQCIGSSHSHRCPVTVVREVAI